MAGERAGRGREEEVGVGVGVSPGGGPGEEVWWVGGWCWVTLIPSIPSFSKVNPKKWNNTRTRGAAAAAAAGETGCAAGRVYEVVRSKILRKLVRVRVHIWICGARMCGVCLVWCVFAGSKRFFRGFFIPGYLC